MILLVITGVFCVTYICWMAWLIMGWRRLPKTHIPPDFQPGLSVTVIIIARNEEAYISQCLDSILNQSYPSALTRVTVVNDHSSDRTLSIVSGYEQKGVNVIDLQSEMDGEPVYSYKKLALQTAINDTDTTLIATVDADCTVEYNWLSTMVAAISRSGDLCVIGPVMIENKTDFFSEMQALEMASLTGVAAASAGWDKPLVANAANMCYSREAFLSIQKVFHNSRITSGDDIFLLQQLDKLYPGKTTYCKAASAVVTTKAEADFISFFHQRLRWASKIRKYQDLKAILISVFILLFDILILINAIAIASDNIYATSFAIIVLVKSFSDIFFLRDVVTFFDRRALLDIFLPTQLFRWIYVILTGFAVWITPIRWKGRRVYK